MNIVKSFVLSTVLLSLTCEGQNLETHFAIPATSKTKNYFGFEKYTFNSDEYKLLWSAKTNGSTYIEDFFPKNSSITHFDKKVSFYLMKNKDYQDFLNQKYDELAVSVTEQQLDGFVIDSTNKSDVVIGFVEKLDQGGRVFVVQNKILRIMKNLDDIVVFEWQLRSYDNFPNFMKICKEKKDEWFGLVKNLKLPEIKLNSY